MNLLISFFLRNAQSFLKLLKIRYNISPKNFAHLPSFEENNICQCLNREDCQTLNVSPFLGAGLLNTSHCQIVQKNLVRSLCRVPHTLSEQIRLYEKQHLFDLKQPHTRPFLATSLFDPLKHEKSPIDDFFPPLSYRDVELLEQQSKAK